MNQKLKHRMIRSAAVCLTLLMLLFALVSCGAASNTSNGITAKQISIGTAGENANARTVAEMLVANSTNLGRVRSMVVAALHGYDMTAEDFDASEMEAVPDKDLPAEEKLNIARQVVSSMNDKATADSKVNAAMIEALTESDFEAIVSYLSAKIAQPIAEMVGSAYESGKDTRAYLIAAAHGYDVTVAQFDGNNPGEAATADSVKLTYAKRYLRALNDEKGKNFAADIQELTNEDVQAIIGSLQVTVDTSEPGGFWNTLYISIGRVLKWITTYLGFGSYIVGICIFAILIEILMIPFAIKQQKNSIKQASLRPKEMAIRKKYQGRNDQATMQKMQQEIQAFYQKENYSPYSGCLPLLVQLPIIMVLYQIVIKPLQYVLGLSSNISGALSVFYTTMKAAGGLGGAAVSSEIELLSALNGKDLSGLQTFEVFSNGTEVLGKYNEISSSVPNFGIGKLNLGLTPGFGLKGISLLLLLVPVLTFVAYFFSAKLTRKFMPAPITNEGGDKRQVACSNAMTDITMPAMSTVFTFMVPAVVGVYWIFRSLLALLKSFIMSKIMPLPTFTKEDYEKAEKEMKGKKPVVKSANVGKVRSLHHIDDEDYEDTRDAALARKAALEAEEAAKNASADQDASIEQAPLKDESDKAKKDTKKKKQ